MPASSLGVIRQGVLLLKYVQKGMSYNSFGLTRCCSYGLRKKPLQVISLSSKRDIFLKKK